MNKPNTYTYPEIANEIRACETRLQHLKTKLKEIQNNCTHSRLPKREPKTKYRDVCPDCGYVREICFQVFDDE